MTLKSQRDKFITIAKRILKNNVSTNAKTLATYREDIVNAYNTFIQYIEINYDKVSVEEKQKFIQNIEYIQDKFLRCLSKLSYSYEFIEGDLQQVDPDDLVPCSGDFSLSYVSDEDDYKETKFEKPPSPPPNSNQNTNQQSLKMDKDKLEFVNLAARTINKNYAGEPLGLTAFINSINFLRDVGTQANEGTLRTFILTKLEGKALEALPTPHPNTIDEIIASLRTNITPDNSKVIEGRMLALRCDNSQLHNFTKQAEELAEALKRTLVIEGMTSTKANEITIQRTIEMCRASSKTDLVKSVLASSTFKDSKEVLSKFVIETANEVKDKQILAYKTIYNNNNKKRGNHNHRYPNSHHYQGYNNNRGRNPNYNNYNNRGRGGYSNNNSGYTSRQFQNSNYRGRGSFRGNHNNGYSNNNQYIRYTENYHAPSTDRRGTATQNDMQGINNHQLEQFTV